MSKKNKITATPNNALPPATTPDPALSARETLPPANIKFCGRVVWDKNRRKVVIVNDPIETFSDCGEVIKLPPADFQKRKRLFYHKDAARIARTFSTLYKIIRRK